MANQDWSSMILPPDPFVPAGYATNAQWAPRSNLSTRTREPDYAEWIPTIPLFITAEGRVIDVKASFPDALYLVMKSYPDGSRVDWDELLRKAAVLAERLLEEKW